MPWVAFGCPAVAANSSLSCRYSELEAGFVTTNEMARAFEQLMVEIGHCPKSAMNALSVPEKVPLFADDELSLDTR